MSETQQEIIADVGAAAEAFTADDGAPLHEIESLCMRCGENVCSSFALLSHSIYPIFWPSFRSPESIKKLAIVAQRLNEIEIELERVTT